jgi:hypothetical protein
VQQRVAGDLRNAQKQQAESAAPNLALASLRGQLPASARTDSIQN